MYGNDKQPEVHRTYVCGPLELSNISNLCYPIKMDKLFIDLVKFAGIVNFGKKNI